MNYIEIDKVEENMVLAEDIINSAGIIILAENSRLNVSNIRMLKNIGFTKLRIKTEQKLPFDEAIIEARIKNDNSNKKLKLLYDDTINNFKNIYASAQNGEKININKVNNLMVPVLEETFRNKNIITSFTSLNKQLGDYTYKHSVNVGLFSAMIGKWLEFSQEEIKNLAIAGILHDIGKVKTPAEIINKKGKLTEEEFEIIKRHPVDSYYLIKDVSTIPMDVKLGVYQHHEKLDGSGYPQGIKGDEIHEFAKIIAIADIYDSLISVRSYKEAFCPFKVYEMLLDMANSQLDYYICSTFIRKISNFLVGNYVSLNTGETAKIVMLNKNVLTKPLLLSENNHYIDLAKDYSISIEEVL